MQKRILVYGGGGLMKIKLKRCPFCGGEAKFLPMWKFRSENYWVRCVDCGCETPAFVTQKLAAEAWNRRAGGQDE